MVKRDMPSGAKGVQLASALVAAAGRQLQEPRPTPHVTPVALDLDLDLDLAILG